MVEGDYDGWTLPLAGRKGCLAVVAALLLLAAAALAVHRYGATELKQAGKRVEDQLGPTDPAAYALPAVAAGDNVALRLQEVAAMIHPLESPEDNLRVLRASHRPTASWNEADRQAVRRMLVANAGALARARGMSELAGSNLGIDYGDPASKLPELAARLQTERLLRIHTALAAADGDPEVAVGSIAALGRIAEALYAESRDLPLLVAARSEQDQLDSMRDLLQGGLGDPALLARLDGLLVTSDPFAALRRVLGYRAAAELARAHRGALPRSSRPIPLHWRLVGAVAGDLLTARGLAPGIAAAAAGEVPLPALHERLRAARSSLPLGPWSPPRDVATLIDRTYRVVTARRLARAALAVRRYRAEHGAWPERLPQPAREPVTGAELSYRLDGDGSAILEVPAAEEVLADAEVDPTRQPLWWVLPAP